MRDAPRDVAHTILAALEFYGDDDVEDVELVGMACVQVKLKDGTTVLVDVNWPEAT